MFVCLIVSGYLKCCTGFRSSRVPEIDPFPIPNLVYVDLLSASTYFDRCGKKTCQHLVLVPSGCLSFLMCSALVRCGNPAPQPGSVAGCRPARRCDRLLRCRPQGAWLSASALEGGMAGRRALLGWKMSIVFWERMFVSFEMIVKGFG